MSSPKEKKKCWKKLKKLVNNSLNFPRVFPTYDKWLLLLQYSHIEAQQNRLKELINSEFPHILGFSFLFLSSGRFFT